jgi:amino acid adenylation domain-containing protein
MNKQNVEDLYPLSPLQQGMLFHTLLSPGSGAYSEQITYDLAGPLQVDVFHRCWQDAMARHPALRTAFFWEGLPKPLQVVHRQLDLPMHVEDLRELGAGGARKRVAEFLEEDRLRGYDLTRAPLVRVAVFRTEAERWVGLFSFHHMLLDGWSLPIVFQEVIFAYEAVIAGMRPALNPPRPFREYIAWLSRQSLSGAEAFWRRALAGFREPTPIGFATPEHPGPGFHKSFGRLSAPVVAALQGLARRHKVTLNNVVQAAWALILSRWSGSEDVVFGATVSGRPADLEGVERMVGMFINTLPVRARVEPGISVDELLDRLHAFMNEARLYEHAPLVDVQGWSEVPRDRSLFDTLYVFENAPLRPRTDELGIRASSEAEVDELRRRPPVGGTLRVLSAQSPERTNYPALLVVAPEGDEMALRLNVDTLRYEPAAGERMMQHLVTVLHSFAADPAARLGDIRCMPAEEVDRVRAWSLGEALNGPEELLHPLFEAQAGRTPNAVALEHEGRQVTYAELEAGANRLAHHLVSLGVGPERRVGVCMRRTPRLIEALLAVLKAGGAYVPLDPAYPAERIGFMVDDTDSVVLLTEAELAAGLPETRAALVAVDADADAIAAHPSTPPRTEVTPRNLAYVIYTSGSTGRPKGVMIEHRSSASIVRWMRGEMTDDEISCVLGSTSISFDVSIAEIFGTICWGGKLVLVENALSLATLSADVGIRTVVMVPSAANELLRMGAIPPSVTTFNLAGEALTAGLAQRLYATGTVQAVRNLYGPTEDTTYSTWSVVEKGGPRVYIGRPLADSRAQVLDGRFEHVPHGIPGELFLAGVGVARGYLNRPALTAERFVPDPHGPPGSRMYRVMDRARWSEAGELEYLERLDHQVKIRGYRIELGEIEAALDAHPSVLDCVVVARGQGDAPRELVAYVAPAPGAEPAVAELRAHLKGQLPAYMLPSFFVLVPELPRSPNGKIDRAALPEPDPERARTEAFVATDGELEETLARVWAEVLGLERVGAGDNFFDLGGHSLLVVQVQSKLKQLLGQEVAMVDLFRFPTVRALAAHLSGEDEGESTERGQARADARRAARSGRRQRHGAR